MSDNLLYHSQILTDLSSIFTPHDGQVPIGKAIFYDGKKRIFIESGRKFGKTDIVLYCLYRWCLLYPNSWCYYIAPFKDQVNDLVWANGRLPNFLPDKLQEKYGVTSKGSEYRVNFRNGSYIKCDGADNYEKGRGYSATGLCVYDEFKDHNPKFHDGFEANLGITDAPLIFVGTPPDESEDSFERWCSIADEVAVSDVGFHICRPSMTNPHVSKEYFERKYKELSKKGELWKWEKEYMAKRVNAGSTAIFPMLDKDKHIKSYKDMKDEILSNHEDWEFHIAFDPGSATCFAVILSALHKFSKKIYVLDEIYATNFATNSAGIVTEQAKKKIMEIMPEVERWSAVYDYAATWYFNEYQTNYDFGLFLNKCEKDLKNKENKLSLIKDMLLGGFLFISDRCEKVLWEMKSYKTDEHGRLKKENDHLIDGLRYTLNDMRYDKIPSERPLTEAQLKPTARMVLIHEDEGLLNSEDIYGSLDSEFYDY